MNRSFLLKVSIIGLLLSFSLNGCKLPWDKDEDDSGGGGTTIEEPEPDDEVPTVSITNPVNGST